jgi:hypothetical protein
MRTIFEHSAENAKIADCRAEGSLRSPARISAKVQISQHWGQEFVHNRDAVKFELSSGVTGKLQEF